MKKTLTIIVLLCLICIQIAAPCLAFEELSKGSKGEAVVELQNRLNELGYEVGKADGSFGGKTEKAIEQFQRHNYLKVTGIADENTQEQLFSENAMTRREADSRDLLIGAAGIDYIHDLALDTASSLSDYASYDVTEIYMYHPERQNDNTYEFTAKVKSGSSTTGYG